MRVNQGWNLRGKRGNKEKIDVIVRGIEGPRRNKEVDLEIITHKIDIREIHLTREDKNYPIARFASIGVVAGRDVGENKIALFMSFLARKYFVSRQEYEPRNFENQKP